MLHRSEEEIMDGLLHGGLTYAMAGPGVSSVTPVTRMNGTTCLSHLHQAKHHRRFTQPCLRVCDVYLTISEAGLSCHQFNQPHPVDVWLRLVGLRSLDAGPLIALASF